VKSTTKVSSKNIKAGSVVTLTRAATEETKFCHEEYREEGRSRGKAKKIPFVITHVFDNDTVRIVGRNWVGKTVAGKINVRFIGSVA
jgi:hypothetical protein